MGRTWWTRRQMAERDPRSGDFNLYSPYLSLAPSVSSHEIWAVWPLDCGYGKEAYCIDPR